MQCPSERRGSDGDTYYCVREEGAGHVGLCKFENPPGVLLRPSIVTERAKRRHHTHEWVDAPAGYKGMETCLVCEVVREKRVEGTQ